jgi:hypothetical protein
VGYVVICFFFGLAGGIVGRLKGGSFFIWFLISAVVPIGGLIAALLYRYDIDEPRRVCPNCRHITKLHDAKCMNCGEELEYPDVVIPPESSAASQR